MKIEAGNIVRYKSSFLRNIGVYTGPMPFARGTVVKLEALSKHTMLAVVDWTKPNARHADVRVRDCDLPHRINVCNLSICKG